RMLATREGLLEWVGGSRTLDRPKPRESYLRGARGAVRHVAPGDVDGLYRRLRRFKYRELLRIMVRAVCLGAPAEEIGQEQSWLADALVDAALWGVERELSARYGVPNGSSDAEASRSGFAVVGLGKLGGEDLNFSSDVDVLYLYREDGQTSGGRQGSIAHVHYYTRLAEAVTRALSATTADGFCYRVDLNLRPQGRSGAIVHSLPQLDAYYESFGRTWERAALLKARPVAGDSALAEEFLESVSPFVWRRSLDPGAVDELREMRAQIDRRGKTTADDVKLGRGGIREVEFFANALQLLHGGRNPALRERRTVRALRRLEVAGVIAAPDADALEEAYLFLRCVEDRLQMVDERQTHTLPSSERERARLARSLRFAHWEAFTAELGRHRDRVANAFHQLLPQTAREEISEEPLLAAALDPELAPEARATALAERGFARPDEALRALDRLGKIPDSRFNATAGGPEPQAIRILAEIARTPDPDQALRHFAAFLGALRAPQGYLALLERAPAVGRRLLNLFGQSDYLSQYFLRHPELVDALMQPEQALARRPTDELRRELAARAARYDDPEQRLGALRRFKNEELLRIAINDISDELDPSGVAEQLTALADAALDQCLLLAESEVRERYGAPRGEGNTDALAVLGMGKLGGVELGYHSDLDLIFVYSGRGQDETSGGARGRITHHEYFARVVERLLSFLQLQFREGALYRVDTRLRPSGNKGTLVVSHAAFVEHHQKLAALWERQALVKARACAGDREFGERLIADVVQPLVYERSLPDDVAAEIDRMRMRMEREVARETAERLDAKTGHGGLVDVEFTVQYLQLVHGRGHPSVRQTNTLRALAALESAGQVAPGDARILREGYQFLRRLENRLRLLHGRSMSQLPGSGRALTQLARRLGYRGADAGADLLREYLRQTAGIRDAYARIFRAAPPAEDSLSNASGPNEDHARRR
ncbi:MAG TPA: bifunctional [glutamate--ammonia ligase]-adenylyl-L-tyrosine phosphorylase/[glutamate--ammonia-ligase] adenylyltransferase, partial [Myxococcaceae bacterium]|nr:bifunctional [glutamate--ammonia ligase]-adenylyl-L-tyrosine phosphorylase/[glutamate--ammonia-ligase] adenylyltransferase [Myxococcaceae bacterium]